jgi:23S rRNA pseudouridine2605 synthase
MAERVHKALARLGYGSRREIEEWMRAGRVAVNGKPAAPGTTLSPGDVVAIDGRRVTFGQESAPVCRVLMYHKPQGEICSRSDPEGRPTIFARLPPVHHGRWLAVGRLDVNTTGLILLTTDGELANLLMHPSTGIEREYLVRVLGEVGPEVIERLRVGVELEDGPAAFSTIHEVGGRGANRWFGVVLKEGRNREVRRMWEAAGFKVSRLKRIRFGPVLLPARVRQGRWEELDAGAVAQLRRAAGLGAGRRRKAGPKRR